MRDREKQKEHDKIYYKKNKEYRKIYYQKNRENLLLKAKEYREKNYEHNKEYRQKNQILRNKFRSLEWSSLRSLLFDRLKTVVFFSNALPSKAKENSSDLMDNKAKRKEYDKIYKKKNKVKIRNYNKSREKVYYKDNKERINKLRREHHKKNKKEKNQKRAKYVKNRKKTDILFKLKINISNSIRSCIKRYSYTKKSHAYQILGCTYEEFKTHIEKQFQLWMNWQNYGKYNGTPNFRWDFDHIIPLATSKTENDFIKLNHYTNIQPLCSYINRVAKRNKLNFKNE